MPRPPRDRTTGLPLPSPVVPSTSICLTIQVPNALEYRSALKGALSELGKPWNWAQTEGEDNADAFTAAELMREMIANAIYQLDCGDAMSCADIAVCLTTNAAARDAVLSIVPTVPIAGKTFPPGVPLTPGQMTTPLNPIDECGFDAFWAQVDQYVEFMVGLGQDTLERLELYNQALEAGQNVPMGELLGKLKNSSTGGKVLEFLQFVVTFMKAAYESANTFETRTQIKCDIFCAYRDSCAITIQGTLDVLNDRAGGMLSPADLEDLPSLIDAIITTGTNPALALDIWLLFLMGTAKTAGLFGVQGIDETLALVLELAADDPSNDWETACEECSTPVETRTPVVASANEPANVAGTLSGPDENGFYTVTSTARAGDYAFVISDASNRPFVLTDLSYSLTPQCTVLYNALDTVYFGCPSAVVYSGQTITENWNTWSLGAGPQSMQFKMVAPA